MSGGGEDKWGRALDQIVTVESVLAVAFLMGVAGCVVEQTVGDIAVRIAQAKPCKESSAVPVPKEVAKP